MLALVVDPAQEERLAQVHARMREGRRMDVAARLARMNDIADVVDAYWPVADGWTTLSVEPGFTYVLTLLEHPTDGVAACLLGAVPNAWPPIGEETQTGTPEQWKALDGMRRETWLTGVMHAQAPSRLALVARMQAFFRETEYPALASTAMAGFLLACPAFMDEATRTLIALGDDLLSGHAMGFQLVGEAHGVPARPLLVGEATERRVIAWSQSRPMVMGARELAQSLADRALANA